MNDHWLREHARRTLHRLEQRKGVVRDTLPPLWQELVEHVERKVSVYNEALGETSVLVSEWQNRGGFLTLMLVSNPYTGDQVKQFVRGDLNTGTVTSDRLDIYAEGAGDIRVETALRLEVNAESITFTLGDPVTPEEAANYLLRSVLWIDADDAYGLLSAMAYRLNTSRLEVLARALVAFAETYSSATRPLARDFLQRWPALSKRTEPSPTAE